MKHGIGRKLLSVVLAVMMLVSLLPTAAFADEISSYSAKNIVVNDVVDDSNTGNDTEPADEAPNAAVVNESEGGESTAITTNEELAAAINAADNGATITLGEGTFTTCGNTSPNKSLTFVGAGTGKTVWTIGDLTVNTKGEGNGDYSFDGCDTITFKNMTLTAVSEVSNNYRGFIRIKNTVVEGCTINGMTTYWGYETAQFENVTFNAPGEDYALWIYSTPSVSITNCNFNIAGKGIHVYNEGGYTEPVKVELNNCTITSTKDNKAFVNIKNSNLPCELTLSGDNKMTINGVEAAVEKFYQVQTTEVTETSGKPVTVQTKATDGTLTTIYAVKAEETSTAVAKIGNTSYDTLDAALAYLTSLKQEDLEFDASPYALTLLDKSVWSTAKPVYWAAGERHDYVATLAEALTAAYKANAGKITIVCRPGADVGTMTHGHVADNITIFGNKAYVSGGECDLEVDTYKFSRETGKQDNNGDYLKNNVTILAYQLDNLGVWGQRNTDNIVAVSLVDCDSVNGITAQRVYISGTSGQNAIVVTDCDFETAATAIYSNADGRVEVYNCIFENSKVPVNINHKAAGKMIVDMQKCTFTKCGDAGEWKQFAAPVRFVNSGSGTMETGVRETTFTDTVGTNGDILLGDGRTGENSNDVTLHVSRTDATIQAQKPGYYNGDTTDTAKMAKTKVKSGETLETTVEKLLPAENVIALDTFIKRVEAANYNYDGKGITVKWSPVSGCYDTREGHKCTVNNVTATGNTPLKVNSDLAQFSMLTGVSDVTIKNVNFVYEAADFTICANSGWAGSYTAEKVKTAQLYLRNSGNTTIEGCSFDNVVFTSFDNTGSTTIANCQFKNIYNTYAIKDLGGSSVSVTGSTFENCGGGVMLNSNTDRSASGTVTITGNNFTKVDVAGTAAEGKAGTRGLIQIASTGDYSGTSFDLKDNTATDCGPVLRQLNQTVVDSGKIDKVKSDVDSLLKGGTTGLGTKDSKLEQSVPAGYVEDEKGNVTISDEAGLFWFAKQANAGNNFAGKTVTLANDIALTKAWTPIGIYNDSTTHFKGTFDGQNHTVSGVQVTKYSTSGVGFFAKTFTATIKNLTVEGKITAYGCNYVGGIVGHGYATITNCTFRGTITNNGGYQVGGIAGSGGFTIKDCAVYGDISAESWVGGIAGNVQDGGAFTNCYVEGTISANSSAYGASAAGIAAIPLYKTQKISGCYSNTVVKCGDEEINAPIIGAYNSAGVTADTELYIYDNSWNKAKNPNDSYEVKDGATVIEGKDVSRDNNLVMLEDDLQYVTDLSKVRIMAGSAVTQEQVDALAVASIGNAKYISLAAAIAAANNGDTVTLLKDVTENVEIAKEKNLTLDLNGCILNGGTGTAKAALTNYGTITIKDSSASKAGTIKRDDKGTTGETSYYVIRNQGTMTIESGNVNNNSGYKQTSSIGSMNGSSLICNGDCDEGGTLTINGGTFTQNNFIAIKNGALGVLHVTGGKITSNHSAIQNWFEADITGGEINGQLWTDAYIAGESVGQTTIGGDATFTGEIVMDIYGSVAPTLAITGGKLDVTNWNITTAAAKAGAKPAVSGGTFKAAVPANYCAEGFIPTDNGDGTFGVKAGAYAAQIGDVKYETLQAAIDAVKANETIYVLGNVDLGTDELSTYDVKTTVKNVTIDLNGYTVTSAGPYTVYLKVNGWTIQNGTIRNTNASTTYGALYVGGSYNSTTLKNLTVESETNGVYFAIASSKNGIKASITVEDGTKISGNYGVYMKGQPKPYRYTRDGQEILNVNGGEITGTTAAIAVFGAAKGNTKAGVIVNINGGKVYSDSYAIAGNGSSVLENTTINISGGKVFSNKDTAIYHPQAGTVTISGGEVYGVTGGVQMCAGTLNVTGGTISATGNGDVSGKTGDGSIPDGAAVSIVNREYPAGAPTMTISGGTFTSAAGVGAVQAYGWKNNSQQTWDKPNASVSGGTFSSAVKEEYCATGYIPTANADGTFGVKEGVYVAKVDNVKYETLQEAINAAKGGSTVRLLADVTLTETAVFPAGKTVHLNLWGHNITATGTALRINGTTDIQSTGSNGVIESTGNVAVAVGDNASLTVYSGTLKGREGAVITGTSTGAKIEIRTTKPTLIATDNAVIAGNGSKRDGKPNTILVKGGTFIGGIVTEGYIACGIYAPWNDNVTVSGGTFNITNGAGIVARAGNVKVTFGTFNCGNGQTTGWVGDSKNKVPNAALVFDKAASYPALTESSQILVSGGTFSTDPAANGATLATGYVANKDESGMYKVAKANPVAAIGDVKYDTLQAAITAAQDTNGGATITLLKNINTESYYTVNGDNPVTIDLAGHNITGSGISGLFYVTAKGDLTIKGEGTVTAVEDTGAAMAVWVRSPIAKVTLEGGTYTQQITNTADPHFDLIYVERGNVYVKGGTYEGATPDWTLNCKDENYPAEAKIEVTGGTFVGFDPANNTAEGEGTNFVPAGYVSTKGADGNFVVTEVKVAEVNGKQYGTLSEAIAAATDGDTVKLLTDIDTPEISYTISKSLTIDLNGKTVTGDGYDAVFQIDNADAKVLIKNGNIVAVENTGSAGKYAMAIWACKAECEVTLENLNVSQKITHTDDKQMDMIYTSGGTIIINSGNFVSGTPAWTLNCKDAAYKAGTANIIVTGGTFKGFDPANNKAEGENTNFVAAGYKSVDNGDGTYTVTVNENVVAVIGTKEYATLEEATDAAAVSGGTVVLMADVTEEKWVGVESNVTLDLNGHSITGVKGFFANGNVIDTSATKGVVSAKGYTMNPTNAYLPIYDSERAGYSFFNLKVLSGSKMGTNSVQVRFQLEATAERDAAFALMKKGATLSHVQACVSITWVEGTTIQSQTFTFNDAFMAAYCATADMVFDVVFSGLDNIKGSDVKAVAKFATSNINGSPMCSRDGKDLPIK